MEKTNHDWIIEVSMRLMSFDYVQIDYLVRLSVEIVETFSTNVRIIIDEDEKSNNNYR